MEKSPSTSLNKRAPSGSLNQSSVTGERQLAQPAALDGIDDPKDVEGGGEHHDAHFGRAPSLVTGARRVSSFGTAAQHRGHSTWIVSRWVSCCCVCGGAVLCRRRVAFVVACWRAHARKSRTNTHTHTHARNRQQPPTNNDKAAVGHLLTAIIGAGVLGLPNAVAWLGWVAGPVAVLLFYAISVWLGVVLSMVYHAKGQARYPTYKAAVRGILGRRHVVVLGTAQTIYQVRVLCCAVLCAVLILMLCWAHARPTATTHPTDPPPPLQASSCASQKAGGPILNSCTGSAGCAATA